jgi:hypothetical protein
MFFTKYAFNATGGTSPRTMPDRLADIVNVLDYGADPTNTNDSAPAFQAAFDAAFGSSSSPHGSANATSNRPVFIPNGSYKLNSTLNLTRVVGGYIYGAGSGATILNRASGTLLSINGAANLIVERLSLVCGGTSVGNIPIDLDWDNVAGGDGLHNNVFCDLLIQNCNIGIRIAHTGNGGANNLFQHCTIANMVTGIDAQAASATNNVTILGGGSTLSAPGQVYWSSSGSINVFEPSIGDSDPTNGACYGVRVDSGLPVCVVGGRSEYNSRNGTTNANFLKVTSGLVAVRAFNMASGKEFANITGGKVTLDSCNVTNSGSGLINGTAGTLYLRGCSLGSLAGYSGTVAQNI